MRALQQRIRKERELNLLLARWASFRLSKGEGVLSPQTLQEVQDWNVHFRLKVERLEQELKRRRGIRSNRIARRFGRTDDVHAARRNHEQAVKELSEVMERRKVILLQVGDACAWTVLNGLTRVLYPLFRENSRSTLPLDEGLAGPLSVVRAAHDTGRFLVIYNDLTRSIGLGDLTVVRADTAWQHPLLFEAKTTRPDVDGNCTIGLHGVEGGWPVDQALVNDFRNSLRFEVETPKELDQRGERQVSDIVARTELMVRISSSSARALSVEGRTLWRGLSNVLSSALRSGTAYDILEDGVYILAVRNEANDNFTDLLKSVLERLQEDVFAERHDGWRSASSEDILERVNATAFVPPIMLWRIDRFIGCKILCEELFFAGYVRNDVWERAFKGEGLELVVTEASEWRISNNAGFVTFNPVEVTKLVTGVLFSGISPTSVARAVRADLRNSARPKP